MKKHKKALLVFAVLLLLGVWMGAQGYMESKQNSGRVVRGAEGNGSESKTFAYRADGKTGEVTVDVSSVQRSEAEAQKLLEQAAAEWERRYLGDNRSADEVRTELDLPDSLCGGLVDVAYVSSDADLLNPDDGRPAIDRIAPGGSEVELRAEFTYGSVTRVESRTLRLVLPEPGSAEWIGWQIAGKTAEAEQESRESESFALPAEVGGHAIQWERQRDMRWLYVVLLGAAAAVCLEWRERESVKKAEREKTDRLMFEYPRMVEQMALLLGSGMTILYAWERMLSADRQISGGSEKEEDGYLAEMRITYREIREGCGEREAYERFGKRIGLLPYRRFAAILSQNLTKGTRDVRELLAKEADGALELRRNHAKKLGEEAGTKLLFPMLLMFVLILLVLLFPAVQNF